MRHAAAKANGAKPGEVQPLSAVRVCMLKTVVDVKVTSPVSTSSVAGSMRTAQNEVRRPEISPKLFVGFTAR
jgi:hypothetical protein